MSLQSMLNLDFVLILQAGLFLFLGLRLRSFAQRHSAPAWNWLGFHAGVFAILTGMRLAGLEGFGAAVEPSALLVVTGVATSLLLEFARRQHTSAGPASWHLLPVGTAIGGFLAADVGGGLDWALGGLGLIGAATCLLANWPAGAISRRSGYLLAGTHLLGVLPDSWDQSGLFVNFDGLLPWARCVFTLTLTWSLLYDCRHHDPAEDAVQARARRQRSLLCGAAIASLCVGCWLGANYAGRVQDNTMRQQILARTQIAAAGIAAEDVAGLFWDDRDLANPHYQKLKLQMIAMRRANADLRFALLAGVRDGQAYFLVDSEPPDSEDYSPPGQHYSEATADYLAGLHSNRDFILGPETDRWGTWMFGDAPIFDSAGKTLAYLELDVAATDWDARILRARLPVLLITLLIIALVLGAYHTLERQRENSAQIALSEQRNRSLVEGSPDCVQMFDLAGRCVAVNRNGLQALGLAEADVLNRPFVELWPAESRERIAGAVKVACIGRPASLEAEYLHPDGRRLTWRVATNPVCNQAGKVSSFVAICVDLSTRKHMELALRAAKKTAEDATQAKSDFLAVMSHEIRTPLSGVIGMLDLLQQSALDPLGRRYTRFARDSADSLMHLLNDALDSAKIEAGKLTLESAAFRPRTYFEAVFESAALRAASKNLFFRHHIDPAVPAVLVGDPARLRQVINNLVNNALKFTAKGGVTCTLTTEAPIAGAVRLRISVTDTGIGISEQARSRLFAKYAQADASTSRQYGGTGLGLSIVKSLAELMGGDVTVASIPGSGSTFTFTGSFTIGTEEACPVASEPAAPRPALPTAAAKLAGALPAHRLRVLIVDDDVANRTVAESLVTNLGHHVAGFALNGREAVDRLLKESFDVVLMDNRMPVMDGFTATQLIRDPATGVSDPAVYIVALTANASADDRARCLAAGMNDFITKPVRAPAMSGALNRAAEYVLAAQPASAPPSTGSTGPAAEFPGGPGLSADELLASLEEPAAAPAETGLDPATLAKISAIFFRETPRRFASMRASFTQQDAEAFGREAHTLKSNARYLSAHDLSAVAAEMEQLADAHNLAAAAALLPRAESLYAVLETSQAQPTQP